jgi:hypothetical protein
MRRATPKLTSIQVYTKKGQDAMCQSFKES